jgi:8-hydroxy-5-deazaflavin:NADPH oxidoreductase
MEERMRVGVLGFGSLGSKLAALLLAAGHDVVAGLRDPAKAAGSSIKVKGLREAAEHGECVVVAIPYTACAEVLPQLAFALRGKIVVDATNPLNADWSPLLLGQDTSAAEEIARLLPTSQVVKAFNSVFADVMVPSRLDRAGKRATVFIAGDDRVAVETVERMASDVGFATVVAGPLRVARHLEALAHLNIAIYGRTGSTNAAFLYDMAPA